jgi:glycosyltransferase involved in cell wall biosynthesis
MDINNSPHFFIVVTGYNWKKFVKPCLDSIKNQTYKNYSVVVVDDGSTDGSWEEIEKTGFPNEHLIKNYGTFEARRLAMKQAPPDSIIVLLDGDDQLLPDALETVAKQYVNPDILMTYGNYIYNNGETCPIKLHYPKEVHKNRDYRKDIFRCTHLRTFKKEFYDVVPEIIPTESEIKSYPDAELLFSMMEMAGQKRISVIEKPIYIYNTDNPLNTLKRFGKDYEGYNEIINRPKRKLL